MSATALKSRGIEDADTGQLLVGVIPTAGRVKLTVRAGIHDLDCAGLDHLIARLKAARTTAFPTAAGEAA